MNNPIANLPVVTFQFMSPYEDWHVFAWGGAIFNIVCTYD